MELENLSSILIAIRTYWLLIASKPDYHSNYKKLKYLSSNIEQDVHSNKTCSEVISNKKEWF